MDIEQTDSRLGTAAAANIWRGRQRWVDSNIAEHRWNTGYHQLEHNLGNRQVQGDGFKDLLGRMLKVTVKAPPLVSPCSAVLRSCWARAAVAQISGGCTLLTCRRYRPWATFSSTINMGFPYYADTSTERAIDAEQTCSFQNTAPPLKRVVSRTPTLMILLVGGTVMEPL